MSERNLVEYESDGTYRSVYPDAVRMLRKGWRVRRSRRNGEPLGRWLKRLLRVERWGCQGSEYEPDRMLLRLGPFVVEHLYSRRRLALALMNARSACRYWVESSQKAEERANRAETLLRELQQRQPAQRTGSA